MLHQGRKHIVGYAFYTDFLRSGNNFMFTLVSLIQFPFFQQSEFLNKRKDDDSSRLLSEISGTSVLFVCANPSISDILECLPHCVDHCEYLKLCRIFVVYLLTLERIFLKTRL